VTLCSLGYSYYLSIFSRQNKVNIIDRRCSVNLQNCSSSFVLYNFIRQFSTRASSAPTAMSSSEVLLILNSIDSKEKEPGKDLVSYCTSALTHILLLVCVS
jgi:hypothetical protein